MCREIDAFRHLWTTMEPGDIFEQLQYAVRFGDAPERFPVGTVLPDYWTDPCTGYRFFAPLIVVDYRFCVVSGRGICPSAVLLRQNTVPGQYQYSKEVIMMPYSGSMVHEELNTTYLQGCSQELRQAIAPTRFDDVGGLEFDALFYVPSAAELHVHLCGRRKDTEEQAWEYFRDTPTRAKAKCQKRVFRGRSIPSEKLGMMYGKELDGEYCWLRGAYITKNNRILAAMSNDEIKSGDNYSWVVKPDGSIKAVRAWGYCNFAPACVVA